MRHDECGTKYKKGAEEFGRPGVRQSSRQDEKEYCTETESIVVSFAWGLSNNIIRLRAQSTLTSLKMRRVSLAGTTGEETHIISRVSASAEKFEWPAFPVQVLSRTP